MDKQITTSRKSTNKSENLHKHNIHNNSSMLTLFPLCYTQAVI